MKIDVTREHIDAGKRADCWHCPVALAIGKALSKPALVGRTKALIAGAEYNLPSAVNDFTWRFDTDLPVKPFSFDLPVEGGTP